MKKTLCLTILSMLLGFAVPFLTSASAPAPIAPVAPVAADYEVPCVNEHEVSLLPGCYCVTDVFAVGLDSIDCKVAGDTCDTTVFWNICGKGGSSGPHPLTCGDETSVLVRCPLGGLAAIVIARCQMTC